MSSSAFTPTTTQVTTEVPVDVPVVTAWESYTPTISNLVGGANISFKYRRVGSNVEINGRLQTTTASPSNSTLAIGLPSGLTIDSSAISDFSLLNQYGTASLYLFSTGLTQVNKFSVSLESATGGTSSFVLTQSAGAARVRESDLGQNNYLEVSATIPIAEWSSGVTTLADRALEEYAWNSDDGAGSNPSSFGYGSDGVLFPAITTTGTAVYKRVRFKNAILPTDFIILEYQQSSTGAWRDAAQRFSNTQAGSAVYGVQLLNVNTTDVEVVFGAQGAVQAGATYGSAGELWNLYRSFSWKWRVRKVSAGAQVGYPISTKNIVGATDGVAPVTGMIGEVKTFTNVTITSTTGSWTSNSTAITTLTPGNWILYGHFYIPVTSSLTGAVGFFSTNSSNDASGQIIEATRISIGSGIETTVPMVISPYSVSSNTSIYVKIRTSGASASVTFKGYAVRIS